MRENDELTAQLLKGISFGDVGSSSQAPASFQVGSSNWSFIDGDTIVDNTTGKRVRIGNVDTRETSKFIEGEGYKYGEAGAELATSYIWSLANKHGFTNVKLGDTEDDRGRNIGDLYDDDGNALSDMLLASGLVLPGFMGKSDITTDQYGSDVYRAGVLRRSLRDTNFNDLNDFEKAAKIIRSAETADTGGIPVQKVMAFNLQEYAANPDLYKGIRTRIAGADPEGMTNTPFGTGWDIGWMGVGQSFLEVGRKLSNMAGFEDLDTYFASGIGTYENELAAMPMMRTDVTEVDWTSFDEATDSIASLMGSSLPYMSMTIAAIASTAAAPMTGGAAFAVPATMYTGLVLDEMEGPVSEKSFSLALGAGALMMVADRVGAKGLISPSQAITKEGRKELIEYLREEDGLTYDQASQMVASMSKRALAELSSDGLRLAQDQVARGVALRRAVGQISKGAAGESATEMMQELTQYTAAVLGSNKEWDFDEVENRLINAAAAGGLLGGTFMIPRAAYDAGDWKRVADALTNADPEDRRKFDYASEKEVQEYDKVRVNEEWTAAQQKKVNAKKVKGKKGKRKKVKSITTDSLAANYEAEETTTIGKMWQFVQSPLGFFQAASSRYLGDLGAKLPTAARFLSVLGHTTGGALPGRSFTNLQGHINASLNETLGKSEDLIDKFTVNKAKSAAAKAEEASKIIDGFYRKVLINITKQGKDGSMTVREALNKVDWKSLDPTYRDNKEALIETLTRADAMAVRMLKETNEINKAANRASIRNLPDWIFRHKGFKRDYIEKNRVKFVNTLMKNYPQLSKGEAEAITYSIINNQNITNAQEAFDVLKGGILPGEHKSRKFGLSDNPEFAEFLDQNFFNNMSEAARANARYQAHMTFFGQDGSLVDQAFEDMVKEAREYAAGDQRVLDSLMKDISKAAFNVRNLLNAESGNYNRIESPFLKNAQKYLTLLTALQGLGLAAFSSLPEWGLLPHGVSREILLDNIGTVGQQAGKALANYMKNLGEVSRVSGVAKEAGIMESGKGSQVERGSPEDLVNRAGLGLQETGAATTTGMTETNDFTRVIADAFFKANFLQDQTQMHRHIRAAFYNDFLMEKLSLVYTSRGRPETNEVRNARRMLQDLGVPVDRMVDISEKMVAKGGLDKLNAQDQVFWETQFLNGATNFINQAVPMPNAFNRPLFYSDPRFMLLTQFNGYVSTFTANQIPRLWESVKGNVGLRYSTFATLATMVFMSFLSQAIKDELKYGESSPYLTDREKVLRGIYSSGLLGTGERILGSNFLFPLYGEDRSPTPLHFLWNNVAGEAAAVGTVERVYGIAEGYMEDDDVKMVKNFYGSLPFLGSVKHRATEYTLN